MGHAGTPAFVVGGHEDFINRSMRRKLAGYGIEILKHLPMDRLRGKVEASLIPEAAQVVLIFYEMVPHQHYVHDIKAAADARGLPCITISRKLSIAAKDLARHGFEPVNPNLAVALAEPGEPDPEEEDLMAPPSDKPLQPVKAVAVPSTPPCEIPATFEGRMDLLGRLVTAMRDQNKVDSLMWTNGGDLEVGYRGTHNVKV